jgi:hypothetical protein
VTVDRQQMIGALAVVATLMFLVSVAPGTRARPMLRRAAVAAYLLAVAAAAVWAGLWLFGRAG